MRLDLRFQERQGAPLAKTQDEAIVHVYVPHSFNGDWEHFVWRGHASLSGCHARHGSG